MTNRLVFLVGIIQFLLYVNNANGVKFKNVVFNSNGSYSLEDNLKEELKNSKILIAVTIKNHAHSLPTFLATLENLKCPNENKKCDLWVIFDNCDDNSYEMFTSWLSEARPLFDTIIMIDTKNDEKTREKHPELGSSYFSKNLKKRALIYAIERSFSYIFFLNADSIITNENTIELLIRKKKPIVAPLLTSSQTEYSTFEMNSQDIEEYEKDYLPIYNRKQVGCFKVFAVRASYMMDLTNDLVKKLIEVQEHLDLDELKNDDLSISFNAKALKISMYACNREIYGYLPDLDENKVDSFTHLRIEHLLKGPNKTYNEPLPITKFIEKSNFVKPKTKLGFDEIYVINLERRQDRRKRIESTLDDLNISYKIVKAVDGKAMDEEYIKSLGIKSLPNYRDPYYDRPLNYGEIGCFLSHYFIWKEMVEKNYEKIVIFEDDAKFVLNFKSILNHLMNSINEINMKWDLIYLGRKIMRHKEEEWNMDIPFKFGYGLINPSYSHWTVSYALTLEGAKKLLKPEPLKLLVPVDEYLPIMYDKQPNEYWSSFFPNRDMKTYAIQPSIVYPTHYTGDPNYVSDTEGTNIINTNALEANLDEINEKNIDSKTKHHIEL